MDAARRVVLFELGMGLVWVLLGATSIGPADLREAWWTSVLAFVALVAVVYADEHRVVAWDEWQRYAAAVVGVIASTVLVGVVAVLTDLALVTVIGAALVGTGAGLLSYRTVYGVVRPVPESRLDAARRRTV